MPSEPNLMPLAIGGVVKSLQLGVRLHLAAVENYETQAAHFGRWGYSKLAQAFEEDAAEEREHLQSLLKRLEFYDVEPDMAHDAPSWPRHDFEGALASNYALETAAANAEKAAIVACRNVGDEVSAAIFISNLAGSDSAIAKIEAIQKIIEQIGLDNYLANQV